MRKFTSLLLAATFLTSAAFMAPASAQDWRHDHDHDFHGGDWHGGGGWHGDIHHFHEYDWDHWRGGSWYHGFHEGAGGWFWIVDGVWYSYPSPVYPYPDPYLPPVIAVQPAPATLGAPPAYVYYCADPAGYYPYVPRCYASWQRVASTVTLPPPPVAAVPPPAMEPAPPPPMEPMPPAPMAGSQREIDDRQLNAFAVEFDHIDIHGYHARSQLRSLEKKVEAFRETLYARGYNAMDILHDADRLEHRIAAERETLSAAKP